MPSVEKTCKKLDPEVFTDKCLHRELNRLRKLVYKFLVQIAKPLHLCSKPFTQFFKLTLLLWGIFR
jgi:hypothetical protein